MSARLRWQIPSAAKLAGVAEADIASTLDLLREAIAALREAAEHVEELEEAWRRGLITEPPRAGGTRSNRNVTVRAAVNRVLALAEEQGVE